MGTVGGASHHLHRAPAFAASSEVGSRKILCIGNDNDAQWRLTDLVDAGWEPVSVSSVEAALEVPSGSLGARVGLVALTAGNCEAVEELASSHSDIEWIAIVSDADMACMSVRRVLATLFYDYHTMPVDFDRLLIMLGHAYGMADLRDSQFEHHTWDANKATPYHQMIGASERMRAIYSMIDKVAPSNFPVLITGESGTGKELVARAIHDNSKRSNEPLIIVNCGAIVPSLIQSELFGHEKGSFTNADARREGYLAAANGGTIFLDEIGELPLETQASLLRVLEESVFRRVGGSRSITSNVRLIAATNRDLSQTVAEGRFREDLFYRLSVVDIKLPSLAERRDDIQPLAEYYLNRLGPEVKSRAKGFSKKALEVMLVHSWPGNVRELINRIKRAALMCEKRLIQPDDLGLESLSNGWIGEGELLDMTLKEAKEEAERRVLVQTMDRAKFNMTLTAKMLGVSRVTLYNLLKKHELR